jgi:hypothetical protein
MDTSGYVDMRRQQSAGVLLYVLMSQTGHGSLLPTLNKRAPVRGCELFVAR